MKRIVLASGLTLAALSLSACASDGSYGYGYSSNHYPYRGYSSQYDGWYGPVYDGYWSRGGTYYYRLAPSGSYYRDHDRHFRRSDRQPGERFQRHHDRGGDHDRGRRGWRGDRD